MASKVITMKKMVYFFAKGKSEGRSSQKNLLGGKGANLGEMGYLNITIPPGFTITTEVCTDYYRNNGEYPAGLDQQVEENLAKVEKEIGKKFGDPENPLLVSVRSGARLSMPGMMETVLNVGLTTKTIPGMIKKTKNERFVLDSYRRLISMYSDVVMEKAAGIEPEEDKGIRKLLEHELDKLKKKKGYKSDTELSVADLKKLIDTYKRMISENLNRAFPDDHMEQLWGAIGAVFISWNGKRAVDYRRIESIPDHWGTAVNVQAMVFGNMGENSATGVAFTRNPATGENEFYGEYLPNAQGEDVVAGIRNAYPLNEHMKNEDNQHLPSLARAMPVIYEELRFIRDTLETHATDMQDMEFTIEEGKLYMLQTRTGKRNGLSAVKMAVDMYNEELIDRKTAIMRVTPNQLDELLHDMIDPEAEKKAVKLDRGLPAGPGGAVGQIVLTADEAEAWAKTGKKVILVREDTSPEDVHGMDAAEGILTARGGMTSHAALVARGWGKCCVVGCNSIKIDLDNRKVMIGGKRFKQGDWITINGTRGIIYEGKLHTIKPDIETNKEFKSFLTMADHIRRLRIRANADTRKDAKQALNFGAEGIGLCRVEHTPYAGGEERLFAMQTLIMSENENKKKQALEDVAFFLKKDVKRIFKAMQGKPVTIRLLDPPLHEFLPKKEENILALMDELDISREKIEERRKELQESNPMLGMRGVRLGIKEPEITRMQAKTILEATVDFIKEGKTANPEIMIPLVVDVQEFKNQAKIIKEVADQIQKEHDLKKGELKFSIGTMVETPRAAITAAVIAKEVDFISFGTNDLTQMVYGFSRDDISPVINKYIDMGILKFDPFQSIDEDGVGKLIEHTVSEARKVKPAIKIGICGEQAGDPKSIAFLNKVGLDYVSMSPFRVPVSRLAAAQAQIKLELAGAEEEKTKGIARGEDSETADMAQTKGEQKD